MSNHILLGSLTRREFRQRMESGELQTCIIPIAAVEQHLEHLAMEHDWRSVNVIAQQVAENLAPHVLVAQGVMAGVSEHHMNHPGTLTLRPGTFLAVVNDLIRSVMMAGFRNVVVLNGHGGNIMPCKSNWDQFLREFKINLHFLSYWETLDAKDAELLRGGKRIPHDLPGHAQEFETAIALAKFPENARQQAIADQQDPSPQLATADTGHELLRRITERVTDFVRDVGNGTKQQTVPPFHP